MDWGYISAARSQQEDKGIQGNVTHHGFISLNHSVLLLIYTSAELSWRSSVLHEWFCEESVMCSTSYANIQLFLCQCGDSPWGKHLILEGNSGAQTGLVLQTTWAAILKCHRLTYGYEKKNLWWTYNSNSLAMEKYTNRCSFCHREIP